jgi:ABC-type multidrug transport system ATPase subunit
MGASGAGKTSLLNIISDRISSKNGAKAAGKIMINDSIELKSSNFGQYAGYVMQDDILFKYFTPKEALTMAARLKLNHMDIKE